MLNQWLAEPKGKRLVGNLLVASFKISLFLPIIIFPIWLFTRINVVKYGEIQLTTDTYVESLFWTKRDLWWKNWLSRINDTDSSIDRTKLLEIYTGLIPGNQWWSPLRDYKANALKSLASEYQSSHSWEKLNLVSDEYIQLISNDAYGWYLKGLSYARLNDVDKANQYLHQALQIEPSYQEALVELVKLKLAYGLYDEANELLNNYQQVLSLAQLYCYQPGRTYLLTQSDKPPCRKRLYHQNLYSEDHSVPANFLLNQYFDTVRQKIYAD